MTHRLKRMVRGFRWPPEAGALMCRPPQASFPNTGPREGALTLTERKLDRGPDPRRSVASVRDLCAARRRGTETNRREHVAWADPKSRRQVGPQARRVSRPQGGLIGDENHLATLRPDRRRPGRAVCRHEGELVRRAEVEGQRSSLGNWGRRSTSAARRSASWTPVIVRSRGGRMRFPGVRTTVTWAGASRTTPE